MRKYVKISRQMLVAFIFSTLIFLTGILRTTVLTRNLSLEDYGVFSLFIVSVSFFSMVLDLGLSNYIVTRLSGVSQNKRIKQFVSILGFTFLYLLLLLVIFKLSMVDKGILSFFGLASFGREFNLVLLIICLWVFSRILLAYLDSIKMIEFSTFTAFMVQAGWVYLLLLALFVLKKISLLNTLFIMLVGALLGNIITLIYIIKDIKIRLATIIGNAGQGIGSLRNALTFGLPLLPFLVGSWSIQVAGKYVLKYFTTSTEVGIYSLGFSITGLIFSVAAVITGVLYPYYSESWNKKKDCTIFVNTSVKYILMITIPGVMGLFVMRRAIVTLISGPDYIGAASVIPFLALFPIFGALSMVFYQTLMLNNRTKLIGLIYLVSGIINIILNIILIPIYGMVGAAVVTTISYLLVFVATFFFAKDYLKIDMRFIRLRRIVLATFLMGTVVYLMNPQYALFKIVTIFFGLSVYLWGIFVLRVFTKKELEFIKTLLSEIKKKLF